MSLRHALLLPLALATAAGADAPRLSLPIACTLGETCHIQQFTDHDPGPGASDFTCGSLAYDGHKGTDIALPSLAAQRLGVAVLAAAPGTVRGTRSTMPDVLQGSPGAPVVTDRECGNGLVIDHGDGWETQYCHMAMDSIAVQTGDTVATGTPLGRVGLSGQTQFPHLHLSLRHDGAVVDPFDPDGIITCGAPSPETLWQDVPATPATGLIATGFAADVPSYDAIKAGTAAAATLTATNNLVLWAYAFGSAPGDIVRLTITGPAGEVITQDTTLDRSQAQYFRAAGRRAPQTGWPSGTYTGTVTLIRDGKTVDSASLAIPVD